jgi:acyl-CoA hydrolase
VPIGVVVLDNQRASGLSNPGAGVVTSRGDVHYVVTEYSVAHLHGNTLRQRTEALIQIAHPAIRDDLLAAARRSGILGSAT